MRIGAWWGLACLALAALGCGPDGDRPRAGWKAYEPPGGQYRVRYLSPPWEQVAPTTGTVLTLEIVSNAERFVPEAGLVIPPKYQLTVDVLGPPSARERIGNLVGDEDGRTVDGEEIVAGPRPVRTASGDTGWELLTVFTVLDIEQLRHRRLVYFDRSGGGVISFDLVANPELDEPHVDQLVEGVAVDPRAVDSDPDLDAGS